jgi:hypothetical protein
MILTFRTATTIGDIVIDAVLQWRHQIVAQVSTSPMEDGADITDHVRVLPQGVEVVGIITPTNQKGLAGLVAGPAAALGITEGDRDVEGWLALKALIQNRRRIEIVTRWDTYFVLPIELLADEDVGFGHALKFTMKFLQIETGSVTTTDQIAEGFRDNVGGKVGTDNLGQQQLGAEEPVPIGKGKSKPAVKNPYNATMGKAA